MKPKRLLSLVLALCTILSVFATMSFTASAATVEVAEVSANTELAEVGKDYGLADNIQDGNILHCFCWKYTDVTAMLPQIAEAGFTSVQVSPPQPTAGTGSWWWFYQPLGFYIGSSELGNKQQLTQLCTEAEKYGIKVIADIVANHLAGDHSNIQNDLKDGQYWHDGSIGGASDGNRYSVTHGNIGMPDLNTEHSYVQQCVKKYVQELASVGVDGIRWDAAKHIGLPSEGDQFWPTVTSGTNLWHYGEILNNPGISNDDPYAKTLMNEYAKYMSITDSTYGMNLRNAFNSGNVLSEYGYWVNRGMSADKLVYWGESHDTWSNNKDWGFSNEMSQNTIDRAYAIAASRDGAVALYFSRPSTAEKDNIRIGAKGSTHFTSTEVAAVNQLKNACVGEKEYYTTGDNCAVVSRESGAVIVLGSGSNRNVTVPNGGGTTKAGTYKDLVSGSTWTVTGSTMSGQVGSSGIAVLLNAKPAGPSASVSPSSKNYTTATLELTLSFENATSGQYSINGGAYQSFTNGQKITIGKGTAAGTQTTISVKASNGSTTSEVETYEYNYSEKAPDGIYFDNSSTNWSTVYCYIYKDGSNAPAQWPGVQMTKGEDNIWSYEPPAGFENCSVLFTDNNGNQTPAANEPGYSYTGGAMICDGSDWKEHTVVSADPVTTPSEAPAPTQTEAPTPTKVTTPTQPTEAPTPTQTQTPAPTPTETVKTDPSEDDIIVVPPSPTKPTTVTDPDLTPGAKYRYGDVDLNGKVSIKDATILQKAVAQVSSLSTLQLIVSNVNADTKANVKDATLIQKYCANVIKSFDAGEWYVVPGATTEATEAPVKPVETDPTEAPVTTPTKAPTVPTEAPVTTPTKAPTQPTEAPVTTPTEAHVTTPTEAPTPDGMITVYFKNDYQWGNVTAHYWNADGSKSTTWPGESMTHIAGDYYSITISDENVHIIFSDNGNYQTADLSIPGVNKYYSTNTNQWHDYTGADGGNSDNNNNNNNNNNTSQGNYIYFRDTENWNCAYAHTWGNGETTWPGTRMDYVEGNLFRIEVPAGHTHIVFNDGNGNRQTGDLTIEIGKAYNYSTGQWENV